MSLEGRSSSLQEWLRTGAAVLASVVVAVVGATLTARSAERATDARFVELAAQILQGPTTDSLRPLRAWAVEVIDRYSEVKLGPKLKQLLSDSLRLSARRSGEYYIIQGAPTFDSARGMLIFDGVPFPSDSAAKRDTVHKRR